MMSSIGECGGGPRAHRRTSPRRARGVPSR
jgi:hypothetical protein